jgi:hypothetical protein
MSLGLDTRIGSPGFGKVQHSALRFMTEACYVW